jgi:hypothetical protein
MDYFIERPFTRYSALTHLENVNLYHIYSGAACKNYQQLLKAGFNLNFRILYFICTHSIYELRLNTAGKMSRENVGRL